MMNEKLVHRVAVAFVFLFAFIGYFLTFPRAVTFWDNGEFIATSYILGIPHPPGSPLFVLLGRNWLLLPLPFTIAGKLNFFSVVCGSLAATFYFLVVVKVLNRWITGKTWWDNFIVYGGGVAAAVLSAFNITVWQNSTEAEVYALANFSVALMTWLTLYWRERSRKEADNKILLLIAFIAGLSVGNHLIALLTIPAIAIFVLLYHWKSVLNTKFIIYASALFLIGLSVYFYLPIRAALEPAINEADPSNWPAFWDVLLRKQYGGTKSFLPRYADFFDYQIPLYVSYFSRQFGNGILTLCFFFVGLYGAVEHYKKDRGSFYYFLVVFIASTLGLIVYLNLKLGASQSLDVFPNPDLHEVRERDYFFLVSFALYGLWVGIGLVSLVNAIRNRMPADAPKSSNYLFGAISIFILLTSFLPFKLNYFASDRSEDYIARDVARNVLASIEPNGVIFTNGDNDTFPLWYMQEVEGYRKDVIVVSLSLLNTPWYVRQLRDKIPSGTDSDPVGQAKIINMNDEAIQTFIQPARVDRDYVFKAGTLEIVYPNGTMFRGQDILVLHIIKANNWRRPVYFSMTVPNSNIVRLTPYLVMQGVVFRVEGERIEKLAKENNNIFYASDARIYIDLDRTKTLLTEKYKYSKMKGIAKDENEASLLANHGSAYAYLALGNLEAGNAEKALDYCRQARALAGDDQSLNRMLASLNALAGNPDEALDILDKLVERYPEENSTYREIAMLAAERGKFSVADRLLEKFLEKYPGRISANSYSDLAKIAATQADTLLAIKYLTEAIELDKDFKPGYKELAKLYHSQSDPLNALAVLEMWLIRHPSDSAIRNIWLEYQSTHELPSNF